MAEQRPEAPWNFSWIVPGQLAGMACPQTEANMRFLLQQGIKHLVTLSPEEQPPIMSCREIEWTQIAIEDLEAPTVRQIKEFIDVCQKGKTNNEAVGVHCRMGRGRTGVMAACYLVHFCGKAPERAITNLRLQRPGSVETREQERAVVRYHDYLRSTY